MKINSKKISVLGREFKLVQKIMERDGLCCPIDELISINPEANNIPRTILHESIHAVFFSGGLFEAIDNEKVIEIICEQVSRSIDENFDIKWKKK